MYSPNVNIKFHQEFSTHFKESNFHSLTDIGSCSLHIIHRSFNRWSKKSQSKLQKVLKMTNLTRDFTRSGKFEEVTEKGRHVFNK